MKLSEHQTFESVLGLNKEVIETYQDNQGFFIRLAGEESWKKVNLTGNYSVQNDPNGGYRMVQQSTQVDLSIKKENCNQKPERGDL